jgi:hypothetical protein
LRARRQALLEDGAMDAFKDFLVYRKTIANRVFREQLGSGWNFWADGLNGFHLHRLYHSFEKGSSALVCVIILTNVLRNFCNFLQIARI